MTKLRWSKEEYTELLNFVKDNYSSIEWKLIMDLMSKRFDRTPNSIKTALVSFNQVNLGIESTSKKGDKIGHCYGQGIKDVFQTVFNENSISKGRWTYILIQ